MSASGTGASGERVGGGRHAGGEVFARLSTHTTAANGVRACACKVPPNQHFMNNNKGMGDGSDACGAPRRHRAVG